MCQNFLELFNMPVGYLVLVGIAFTILCTILKFKKEYKPRGYIKLSDGLNLLLYFLIWCMLFITVFFTILYSFGIKDTSGNELDGHIYLFVIVLLIECFSFLRSYYNKIYFNDNEIIVHRFLKKTKVYGWNDIIGVKINKINKTNKMNDLVVKTNDGNKFCIEFAFNNKNKFEKKLEEKNIVIGG